MLFLLAGCQAPGPLRALSEARQLGLENGFEEQPITAGEFELFSLIHESRSPDRNTLTIYIAGDGYAFISRYRVSSNPTPRNPVALKMAVADPAASVAWLARPCQYRQPLPEHCVARYWTIARYAPEVVAAMNDAVDILKNKSGATSVTLIGYSGGGAIAVLLAERRDDVDWLVTVAGNLDHAAWTAYHGDTPLTESLSPVTDMDRLADVRQLHIAGGEDATMPVVLIANFVRELPVKTPVELLVFEGADHDDWPAIWAQKVCEFPFRRATVACNSTPE